MSSASPHIVCFAPYTDWSIHSARQVTILHALRARGATVSYVTCDGVFSDCDLFQKATGAAHGRQANSCLICQSSVAARLASWNMPYRWLGTWLTMQDRDDMGRWIADDEETYIKIATDMACDRDALKSLRASLRNKLLSSPICNHIEFTRTLERAFKMMRDDLATHGTNTTGHRMVDVSASD
jgi:hypothetical protein